MPSPCTPCHRLDTCSSLQAIDYLNTDETHMLDDRYPLRVFLKYESNTWPLPRTSCASGQSRPRLAEKAKQRLTWASDEACFVGLDSLKDPTMISPLTKQSFLLSSRTVFMLLSGFRRTELFNVLSTALGRGTRSIEHPQAHQTLPERGRERQNKKNHWKVRCRIVLSYSTFTECKVY